jgi:hypothetical protein
MGTDKKNSKNFKSSGLKNYISSTYRKNTKNMTYTDFTRSNRKPPIEVKQVKVKTIMFPNDEKEYHFNEENQCLNKQKEELKELYENMILKLNEEDKLRDEEIRLHTIDMNSKIGTMNKKNQILKKNYYDLTKKYMDLKYDTNQNNQKLKDQMEMTKLQGEALKGNINDLIKKAKRDKELNKKDFDRRTRQVANTLRTQVKTKEETANLALRQFTDVQNMYEDKINEAKNKIQMIENKYLILKEGVFSEDENKKQIHEIEENMKIYRMKMKEFEAYINEIKHLSEGDYDHYDEILKKTSEKNERFMFETHEMDEQLKEFQLLLQGKNDENLQLLKNVKDYFDENGGAYYNNQESNKKFFEDSQNKIIEEDEEKQQVIT